jgi:DoxX-like family
MSAIDERSRHVRRLLVVAIVLAGSAIADFVCYKQVAVLMARTGAPEPWMTMLSALKAAGTVGLLVGIGVPLIGSTAAIGVILFFIGAVIIHVRTHRYGVWIIWPVAFLLMAVAALVLQLASA